jgi:hypothetical protein
LIKSIQPGIDLHLLDGKYTPRNRPIQDLVTFHEVGLRELRLSWPALLAEVCDTPVEPIQLHYMRVATPTGMLAEDFKEGWVPEQQELLLAVLAENRRYLKIYVKQVLKDLELTETDEGWQCSPSMSEATGGLRYADMVKLANEAKFRSALWQMGQAVANLFRQVMERVPRLRQFPIEDGPTWEELRTQWQVDPSSLELKR